MSGAPTEDSFDSDGETFIGSAPGIINSSKMRPIEVTEDMSLDGSAENIDVSQMRVRPKAFGPPGSALGNIISGSPPIINVNQMRDRSIEGTKVSFVAEESARSGRTQLTGSAPGNIDFSQMRVRPNAFGPPGSALGNIISGSPPIINVNQMRDRSIEGTKVSFVAEESARSGRAQLTGSAPGNIDFSQMRVRPKAFGPPGSALGNIDTRQVCENVNEYTNRWWPRTRAAYVRNGFVKPWVIVSQIVVGIVVILTFLQTRYTMKQS